MRIQTSEHGFGAKSDQSKLSLQKWSSSTLRTICRWVDETGSAVMRHEVCVAATGEHFEHYDLSFANVQCATA